MTITETLRSEPASQEAGGKCCALGDGSSAGEQRLPLRFWRFEPGRCDGNSIVEFAFVLPVLLTVITGLGQFGVLYSNMIALVQATTAAAQVLQSDRLSSSNDPCADTYHALVNAAPGLTASKITLTISINNNAPITGDSCAGKQTQLSMGGPVTVQAGYPYSISIFGVALTTGSLSSGTLSEIEY